MMTASNLSSILSYVDSVILVNNNRRNKLIFGSYTKFSCCFGQIGANIPLFCICTEYLHVVCCGYLQLNLKLLHGTNAWTKESDRINGKLFAIWLKMIKLVFELERGKSVILTVYCL